MSEQPVYKLFWGRANARFHQLSETERDALGRRDQDAMTAVGAKPIVLCQSRWHNERWDFWGVEQFASVQVIQEYTHMQAGFDWFRYFDCFSALGTPRKGFEATPSVRLPVVKLFQVRAHEAYYQLDEAARTQLLARVDAAREAVGGKLILLCHSRWHDQRWDDWGVEEYPSVEAVQEEARLLAEIDWYQYSDSVTMLGTVWQG